MSTIPQLSSLKGRLQQLNLQKARYGISADPHINIEADDLATVIDQMELIDLQRRNLDHLVRQRDTFAGNAPVHILNQIVSSRAEVMRLRQACARLGQSVPAVHRLDDDEQTELPPIKPRQAAQPKSDIHAKLDQAIALLIEIRASL